ncbi:DOMON-like domain-containing protein [Anabaena sp. UHCC 0399]|uniref:DOMON-like domain-containing protein n=1 Tax=Anabaena sp. UHCC 0399 TaxID=3110238 RepID=UPI002B1F57AD|nr:DOMON-like domain-containing protein [Anabaena sp. UHCC 0399]MEA5565312.1 DOMON-like domain-containing protein [Anabaena sp. UHCC 0399]
MNHQTFSLQPFLTDDSLPNLKITGNISHHSNHLDINYQLTGDLEEVVIPTPVDTPTRQHKLWENTCFEFFIGVKNSQHYWEFNLSPAGHWNIYRFDNYRQGMQEETAFAELPFSIQNQSDSLLLSLKFNLAKIISENQAIDVAITTVIKQQNGYVTYWALAHTGAEADFHLRESFIIEL